jgi:peptide chain release factor subunit 1
LSDTTILIPERPIENMYYRCDKTYWLDLYESLCSIQNDSDIYAYAIITGDQMDLYAQMGQSIKHVCGVTGHIPGKTRRGGQSSVRYSRLCLEARACIVKRIAEIMNEKLIQSSKFKYKGLFVAGPADRKREVLSSDTLSPIIKNSVFGVYDVSTGSYNGLNECILKTQVENINYHLEEEKRALDRLMSAINKSSEFLVYYSLGRDEVIRCLSMASCDLVLIGICSSDSSKDIIDLASIVGCKICIITDVLPDARQLTGLGGIACVLKYGIPYETNDNIETETI